ncbi:MAG TPA: DUF433 domain-containing protein [Bellilinea sp.]|nr:DUF433 domain-containing protein [Bellilinea sp.]
MSTTVLSIDTIVSNPDIRGGQPTVAGRSITVSDLVARYLRGVSLEDLASNFDLTFGQVHAALAYYYMHKQEIDEELHRDLETANRVKTELEKQGKLGRLD